MIVPVVTIATTTKQMWDNFNIAHANKSQTRIHGFRGILAKLVKDNNQ